MTDNYCDYSKTEAKPTPKPEAPAYRPASYSEYNAEYISVWDGGHEVRTPCRFEYITGRIDAVAQSEELPEGGCDGEFVEYNGEIFDVCPNCGEGILVPSNNNQVKCTQCAHTRIA